MSACPHSGYAHCTLYRSRFGFGICKIEPHIEHWWVMISGSLGRVSSKSSKTVPADVQPTSSSYLSPSSEISDSLSPNLIRRRRRFLFFGAGRDFGLPFGLFEGGVFGAPFGGGPRFAGGFLRPFGTGFFPSGAGLLRFFGGGVALLFFGGGGVFLFVGGGPGGGGACFFGGGGGAPPFFGGGGGGADFSAMIILLRQSR